MSLSSKRGRCESLLPDDNGTHLTLSSSGGWIGSRIHGHPKLPRVGPHGPFESLIPVYTANHPISPTISYRKSLT